jgi:transcriptional regulator with PAS, ATPase and Fis domain
MLVGRSAVMAELRALIGRVARTSFTVLIEGESGVGKEEVAREIHQQSQRRQGPFVAINCAALVETLLEAELFGIEERTATGVRGRRGKFELAHGGTLFLDEVGDLSPMAQAKLLRVLQDTTVERVGSHVARTFDTRVVAATNRTLQDLVASSRFRADLYYRLSGVEIVVPPLRERREDVPLLVTHFLDLHHRRHPPVVTDDAMSTLMAYEWPGNVRQLARVIEHAVALAASRDRITVHDLPATIRGSLALEVRPAEPRHPSSLDRTLREWSREYVKVVLERCKGNKRRACNVLDISFHTLKAYLAAPGPSPRPAKPGEVVRLGAEPRAAP